jgi:hypothetical protein
MLTITQMRFDRNRFKVPAAGDEVEENGRILIHPGISTISTAICLEVELTRKVKATVRMILSGLSTVVLYLVSRQVNAGGRLSIILHILLVFPTAALALYAVRLLATELRLREHQRRFLMYLSCVRQDLRRRGLAFADESAAIRNLSKSLIRVPIRPVNAETMATLQAMEMEEAVSYYSQFGEIKQG